MSSQRATGRAPRPSLTAASTSPPPPLGEGSVCRDKVGVVVPRCSDIQPALTVSYAPPGASLGCYTGTVIDSRYRIGPILGEGGMGIVYRARHVVIDKKVAIKVLRADFARQKDITDRFLQEARAASSIGNPHIIDISDFGELPDGSTYFVMEFLEGAPLSTVLKESGPMPPERLVRIARQIADGLASAHDRGIVHRDLKPENVFVINRGSETDFIKILDFGIAKVNVADESRSTRAGVLFGTPHYMSPEQAAGTPVDSRTDIYALGIIMYELACGRVPFDASDLMGILTQHMYKRPASFRELVDAPSVPPPLEAIILKTLSKDPAQRYGTMQELARDLDKFAAGDTPDAVTEMIARSASVFPASLFAARGMPTPPPQPRTSGVRRPRWGVYAGVAGVLVTCAVALGVLAHGTASTAATQTAVAVRTGVTSSGTSPASMADPGSNGWTRAQTSGDRGAATGAGAAAIGSRAELGRAVPVLFAAQPLDAHVFRDGEDLGPTPLTLDVYRGQALNVEVRRKGYATRALTVDGSESRMTVKLVPTSAQPSQPKGNARARALERGDIINPWAR